MRSIRLLLVGDVHATPEELGDCRRLIDFVAKTAQENGVDYIVFMGDIYNTHNVMRVEVLAFWKDAFEKLYKICRDVIVLVGNHDYAGEGLPIHALLAHDTQVLVVDKPCNFDLGILFLPYMSSREAFVEACEYEKAAQSTGPTVLCHQTFEGSTYENGMYAPDGVDPNLIPQTTVISGHIHTPQSFGKVMYIGAPRWRTLSDANVERAIWIYDFDSEGKVIKTKSFDTGTACKRIKQADHTPE
jgi:DNA repair exonuclease SbcCD nuclease subunit